MDLFRRQLFNKNKKGAAVNELWSFNGCVREGDSYSTLVDAYSPYHSTTPVMGNKDAGLVPQGRHLAMPNQTHNRFRIRIKPSTKFLKL